MLRKKLHLYKHHPTKVSGFLLFFTVVWSRQLMVLEGSNILCGWNKREELLGDYNPGFFYLTPLPCLLLFWVKGNQEVFWKWKNKSPNFKLLVYFLSSTSGHHLIVAKELNFEESCLRSVPRPGMKWISPWSDHVTTVLGRFLRPPPGLRGKVLWLIADTRSGKGM